MISNARDSDRVVRKEKRKKKNNFDAFKWEWKWFCFVEMEIYYGIPKKATTDDGKK